MNSNIKIEITEPAEFHCFRLTLNSRAQEGEDEAPRIEIMLHAASLVDLIHQSSVALCEWQRITTQELLEKITGMSIDEMRARGIIAP